MMINIAPIIRTAPPTPAIIMISLRSSTESVLSCVGELVVKSPAGDIAIYMGTYKWYSTCMHKHKSNSGELLRYWMTTDGDSNSKQHQCFMSTSGTQAFKHVYSCTLQRNVGVMGVNSYLLSIISADISGKSPLTLSESFTANKTGSV